MNVPFVKVNNQQEFDRVVDKMEKETGFKLHESSKCGADSIYNVIGIDDDFDILLYDPSHDDNKHLKIISAHEYLTGTKEYFTLDDLNEINNPVIEIDINKNDKYEVCDKIMISIYKNSNFISMKFYKYHKEIKTFYIDDNEKYGQPLDEVVEEFDNFCKRRNINAKLVR